ncbi:MAG: hypothetical protein ACI4BB_01195, partial [Coprococcus sp.]
QHLWKKFNSKLNALTEAEQRHYFAGQYSALLYAACKGGSKQKIRWTASQIKKYRAMNKKEHMLILLSSIHLFSVYEGLKKKIKKKRSGRIYENVIRNLTEYDLQIFTQALSGVRKDK